MVDTYTSTTRNTITSHYTNNSHNHTFSKPNSNNYHHRHNPSFSSTLLDSIYRSIDQGEDEINNTITMMNNSSCKNTTTTTTYNNRSSANVRRLGFKSDEEMANYKRACMIEKWMDKKSADPQIKKCRKDRENSSWSSSDSSPGFFSSSEPEPFSVQRLKPVRTGSENLSKSHEGGFLKTKSRALKIYGDLKKVKQPISPGGKVAAFLNSLFNGGNHVKKSSKLVNEDVSPSVKSGTTTTCSSASSFSRSCLSKTSSSRGKSSSINGPKRSVRFSPVSMIIDDDCQKSEKQTSSFDNNHNHLRSVIDQEIMAHVMEKNRRVEEAARDLLRNYHKMIQMDQNEISHVKSHVFNYEEEEYDDAASCASSDLFELDNLSAIGMERYTEELPVYETTHLRTNRAIANGLIM